MTAGSGACAGVADTGVLLGAEDDVETEALADAEVVFDLLNAAASAFFRSLTFCGEGTFGSCFGTTGFGAKEERGTGFTGCDGVGTGLVVGTDCA